MLVRQALLLLELLPLLRSWKASLRVRKEGWHLSWDNNNEKRIVLQIARREHHGKENSKCEGPKKGMN
jgi:hypothetical protein